MHFVHAYCLKYYEYIVFKLQINKGRWTNFDGCFVVKNVFVVSYYTMNATTTSIATAHTV